ncbi:GerAB/ArcD/ProY family transporter [Clostridium sporogenes]|uniref:GerAB/ArcD/ProY family transporter n=1 Tax=Clostridium sporogenes TaxID=1509 RepID=UPI002237AFD5|nr:endospore germination permease [Clostridium sporogenes]EKS4345607.1 endospore germination permease [Clostridium botulinum]EKS4396520.1 endospore germination permease [Clostridium botulinum]MCW6077515.1 endospore germination permease [Clostridium sporogenes]
MENKSNNVLTTNQTIAIIVGSMIGIGILSLPADLTKIAENDGWIGVVIGSLYPFYIVLCSILIFKDNSYHNTNIVKISKNYFGKILGSVFSFVFAFQFFIYIVITTASISNLLRVHLVLFLEQYKLAIPILLISVYAASKGIKALGIINEIIFYAAIPLILITFLAIKQGNILNIQPILGAPFSSILKASIETVYSFLGIEFIFLIVPLMEDKTKIKSSFLKSTSIVVVVYIWLSFISIYHLGPDVAKNLYWPTLSLAETIYVPGISNFKLVFMFLWNSIIFQTIANQNYFFYYSLSNISKKINPNILYSIVFIFAAIIVNRLDSFITLTKINRYINIFYLTFNLIFITSITIIKIIKSR